MAPDRTGGNGSATRRRDRRPVTEQVLNSWNGLRRFLQDPFGQIPGLHAGYLELDGSASMNGRCTLRTGTLVERNDCGGQ
ncbi:MAG: hypothetical protein JWO80_2385 [Bryobacterales bacterium]|nr:hypothetical protein [Bryobacterales bacterium]